MSSTGSDDIYIGIRVGTEELSKANDLVIELAGNLEKLRGAGTGNVATSAGIATTREMTSATSDLKKEIKDIPNATNAANAGTSSMVSGLQEITSMEEKLMEVMDKVEQKMSKPKKNRFMYGEDVAAIYDYNEKLKNFAGRNDMIQSAMEGAMYLDKESAAMKQLEAATGLSAEALQNFSIKSNKLNNDMMVMKIYSNNVKAAIGPMGTAFREVTMQLYWASLGFMFYTMTLTRADQSNLTARTNAHNLAKGYYNLAKLQKAAAEATKLYGANSEEARESSVQLKMAQDDLALEQQKLALNYKAQILQQLQGYLSLIPLTVNSMYMAIQAQASLKGMIEASTVSQAINNVETQKGAAAKNMLGYSTTKNYIQTTLDTYAQGANTASKYANIIATLGLRGAVTSLNQALTVLFSKMNLVTMGAAGLAAIVGSQIVGAFAEWQSQETMKKMNADAEKLYSTYQGINGITSATKLESPQLRSPVYNRGNNTNIQFVFKDPVIRDEASEDRIVNKVYKSLNKELNGSGVQT